MTNVGEVRELSDEGVLIQESVETPDIYILLNGTAEVRASGAGVVAVLRAGDVVGEMAMVDHAPPSASVIAVGPVQYLAIEKAQLQHRLDTDAGFSARFFKAIAVFLSARLRKANDLVRSLESGVDTAAMGGDQFHHMLTRLHEVGKH
jgi:CRP-like cAMP-binding protein